MSKKKIPKKKPAALISKDELFYMRVDDPTGSRRAVLESTKDLVQLLQRYEHFLKVRSDKTKLVNQLRKINNDIKKSVNDLYSIMPVTKDTTHLATKTASAVKKFEKGLVPETKHESDNVVSEVKPKENIVKKEKPKGDNPLTEIERLEKELSEIEERLTKLN